jgi:hypothetical protein
LRGRQVVQTWQSWVCAPRRQRGALPMTVAIIRRSLAEQDVDASFFLLYFTSYIIFEKTYERNHDTIHDTISTKEKKKWI